MELGINLLGLVSLIATLFLGLWVYKLQRNDASRWQTDDKEWKSTLGSAVDEVAGAVETLDIAVRSVAEAVARLDQERIDADPTGEAESNDRVSEPLQNSYAETTPPDVDVYIGELKSRGIPLDYKNLNWRKKIRNDGGRGNLGWFVNDGGNKRYFVHRGRGTAVREAIPRSLLEAWEQATGRDPSEVELDYQTGAGRGNHAWYLRTYGGQSWRIAAGGKGKTGPTVTPLETT